MKANPAIVTAVMKNPPEIKGETDMLVQVHGSFDNPQEQLRWKLPTVLLPA